MRDDIGRAACQEFGEQPAAAGAEQVEVFVDRPACEDAGAVR